MSDYPFENDLPEDDYSWSDVVGDAIAEYGAISDELPSEMTEKDFVIDKLKMAGYTNHPEALYEQYKSVLDSAIVDPDEYGLAFDPVEEFLAPEVREIYENRDSYNESGYQINSMSDALAHWMQVGGNGNGVTDEQYEHLKELLGLKEVVA